MTKQSIASELVSTSRRQTASERVAQTLKGTTRSVTSYGIGSRPELSSISSLPKEFKPFWSYWLVPSNLSYMM